jgi:hypothetical protein
MKCICWPMRVFNSTTYLIGDIDLDYWPALHLSEDARTCSLHSMAIDDVMVLFIISAYQP